MSSNLNFFAKMLFSFMLADLILRKLLLDLNSRFVSSMIMPKFMFTASSMKECSEILNT
jgi:hypothetical protein